MLNRRFLDLKINIGNNIRDTSTSTLNVIGDFINDAYQEYMARTNNLPEFPDYSLTATAGTRDYVLPDDFHKEIYVLDYTNGIYYSRGTSQSGAIDHPSLTDTAGTVYDYYIIQSPVRSQPASASIVTVKSSDNNDQSQIVRVLGKLNGVEVSASISLGGTLEISSTVQFDSITKISKSGVTLGNVTVTAGTTTLGILSTRTLDYGVDIIRFRQAPSGSYVYKIPYYAELIPMTNDNDVPQCDCGAFLLARGTAKALKYKRQFAKAAAFDNEAERMLDDIMWREENNPNQLHQFKPVPYSRETV